MIFPRFCYDVVMKRNIIHKLEAWKASVVRKPLILQGARQVGKTTILRDFAQSHYDEFVHVDFDRDRSAQTIFSRDLNPERILQALRIRYERTLKPKSSLIILDEIQECPNALNSLKYFNEEANEYHIVAAGSLLGVKLANNRGFPVGKVDFLELLPMSFFEFLTALGRRQLVEHLEQISEIQPLETVLHEDLCELLKEYLYIGGMPEAVKAYIDSKSFEMVRSVQENIIKAYVYDFAKHAPAHQVMKITMVWQSLASQLAKENKKFSYARVHKNARSREYEDAIQWLIDAGLVYLAYQVSAPRLPLPGYTKSSAFKMYLLDVGILGAMAQLSAKLILERNVLFTEYKGALTENLAAQLLRVAGFNPLHYWSIASRAEVDFLLVNNNNILPLEVKAGMNAKNQSLRKYVEKYRPRAVYRASLMNFKQDGNLINYPLYLLEKFPRFLDKF